jgi:intracellular sulfur oxidation DsrE/DsrF family protein
MSVTRRIAALCCAVLLSSAVPVAAQQWPVPGVEPAKDVPGAKELPDPATEYKLIFMVGAGPKPTEVNPTLTAAARYLNTLAKWGVPAEKRKFVVMIRGGMDMILKDEAYQKKHPGQHNPNIAIIQALSKAGVSVRVCGQGVLGLKYESADILPEVQVDLWALSTMVNFELKGYVKIG